MPDEIKKEDAVIDPAPPIDPPTDPPPTPEPEPIWKKQGFTSADEAIADALGHKAAAEVKARGLQEDLAKVPKPMPPAPILKPEDADDPAAVAAYQQEVVNWQVEVMKVASAPSQPSPHDNTAAIEKALVAGEFLGVDRHVLRGTIESMSYAPEYAALATTPEGLEQLGKLAMKKLKPEETPAPDPPEPDPPEKQYQGDKDAVKTGKDLEVADEETKRKEAVRKAIDAGDGKEVVKLAMQKGRSLQIK